MISLKQIIQHMIFLNKERDNFKIFLITKKVAISIEYTNHYLKNHYNIKILLMLLIVYLMIK
jgi:hypothetical protein